MPDKFFPAQGGGARDRLSSDQLGQRRTTGNRRDASAGEKTQLYNSALLHPSAQLQNVAAGGIFELNRSVRVGKRSRMTRMLEVIEDLRRVHETILDNLA